jgi:hypothetical protein
MNLIKRPKLTPNLCAQIFKQYYWLKKELTDFCTQVGLSTAGMKPEIVQRIYTFLETGKRLNPVRQNTGALDSDKPITLNTPVVHYKNDPKTRDFFIKHIGPHFTFSARVNIFRKDALAQGKNITYGDLIAQWLEEYALRKDKSIKLPIMKSCEYNQFTRDYYVANPNAERKLVIAAWKQARTLVGQHTYQAWVKIFKAKI